MISDWHTILDFRILDLDHCRVSLDQTAAPQVAVVPTLCGGERLPSPMEAQQCAYDDR